MKCYNDDCTVELEPGHYQKTGSFYHSKECKVKALGEEAKVSSVYGKPKTVAEIQHWCRQKAREIKMQKGIPIPEP